MAWQQYRRVDAGSISVEDLDMRIEVEDTSDDGHRFDVQIWNLAEDTWKNVSEDDYCRITLGWEDGDQQSVMHGIIEKKTTESDGNDRIFRLKGSEVSDHLTKKKMSKTYGTNQTPSQIAKDLAGECGLTAGDIGSIDSTVTSNFIVSKDKPVRHWLDELIKEAESMTNAGWEWFVDGGRLYFVRKDGRTDEAVELSYNNTLVSINESDGEAEDSDGLEFEAMLEPSIRRGAALVIDTDDYNGAYRVRGYTFVSDTTSGDHHVEGKLDPLDMNYTIS